MKEKIAMIVQNYYARDARVRRQAEALIEKGHEVDVIALKDNPRKFKNSRCTAGT